MRLLLRLALSLFRWNSSRSNDGFETSNFALAACAEFFWGTATRYGAEIADAYSDIRHGNYVLHASINPLDNSPRQVTRAQYSNLGFVLQFWQDTGNGWYAGQGGQRIARGDTQRSYLATGDLRQPEGHGVHHDIHSSSDDVD